MTFSYQVKRSNTGKYHLGVVGGSSANCNGRSGHFTAASARDIEAAPDSAFCVKCFKNRKQTITDLVDRSILKL